MVLKLGTSILCVDMDAIGVDVWPSWIAFLFGGSLLGYGASKKGVVGLLSHDKVGSRGISGLLGAVLLLASAAESFSTSLGLST